MSEKKVDVKSLDQGKPEPKKRLCLCSPTNHPGSFTCRYHRAMAGQKLDPAAGGKPQLSRFSKAGAAVASELPR